MKNKKFTSMLLVAMLLLSCVVTGCGKSITPKECAQVWWELSFDDTTNVSKLKMKEAEVKSQIEESNKKEISKLKRSFSAEGMTITDEQVKAFYNAMIEVSKKATVTIDEVSNDGKIAEVKYKSNYIDMNQIATKAIEDAIASVQELGLTSEKEIQNKYAELFMKNLTDGIKNAKFSDDTKEVTYKLTKKDGIWTPDNQEDLADKLNDLFLGEI